MKKTITTVLLFLLTNNLFAQVNLVPNGDFENYSALPTYQSQSNRALGWNNVNGNYSGSTGSPDYFNTLSFSGTALGAITPFSGYGQMGFILFEDDTNTYMIWREYISAQLSTPMIYGSRYSVSF